MAVLITGTNRGLGKGLFDLYHAEGETWGTARSGDGWIGLEMTDDYSIESLPDKIRAPALELLICNAGILLDRDLSMKDQYSKDIWAQSFAVNTWGVFFLIQALLPKLRQAKTPKIAIISSMMASHTRARGHTYAYRASKAAVLNIGRSLAAELRPEAISVGIFEPGWVRTKMGTDQAPLDVSTACRQLKQNIDALDLQASGRFIALDGSDHPF